MYFNLAAVRLNLHRQPNVARGHPRKLQAPRVPGRQPPIPRPAKARRPQHRLLWQSPSLRPAKAPRSHSPWPAKAPRFHWFPSQAFSPHQLPNKPLSPRPAKAPRPCSPRGPHRLKKTPRRMHRHRHGHVVHHFHQKSSGTRRPHQQPSRSRCLHQQASRTRRLHQQPSRSRCFHQKASRSRRLHQQPSRSRCPHQKASRSRCLHQQARRSHRLNKPPSCRSHRLNNRV